MQIFRSLEAVPAELGPAAVSIGNFDGVHRGHRRVLAALTEIAESEELGAVVLTFDPHPAVVHNPEASHPEIMPLSSRLQALEKAGVDAAVVVEYSLEFADQSAEEFVRGVLKGALHAQVVVVGQDARFGRGNSGGVQTLRELGPELGFETVIVEEFEEQDGEVERRCSSTWIRSLLAAGNVERAAAILGSPHRVEGEVVHGFARGRELGFPTANLTPEPSGLVPADGVYAGWLIDESGASWPTAISVGTNPTFEGVKERTVEAHVIDRPADEPVEAFDLYGQHVAVEFVHRLRGMVAFSGAEALVEQIREDVDRARDLLAFPQSLSSSSAAS